MSEAKISEAAVDSFERAYYHAWRESTISFPQRTISSHVRQANRAALEAALPHLHPQPAELAEQQGVDAVDDQLLDELRDVEDYFNDVEPNPIHLATVQAAISALATTGKQQVGEVQGDALLPCPFCGESAERIDFGPGSGDNEGGSCVACTGCGSSGPVEFGFKENFRSIWNRRALAARQPGV